MTAFSWEALGTDGGGLPTHLPLPVTAKGQGPAVGDEAHHLVCWCGENCPLNRALDEAWRLGSGND